MTGRGYASAPVATTGRPATSRGTRFDDQSATEMTTIIPIDEFDDVDDQWGGDTETAWDSRTWEGYFRPTRSEITQDLLIPEGEFADYENAEPISASSIRPDEIDDLPPARVGDKPFRTNPATRGGATKRGGKHRISAPPTALKGGRAALIAMAAGAAVASVAQVSTTETVTPQNAAATDPAGEVPDLGPGIAAAPAAKDMSTFTEQLGVGKARAAAEAQREALLRRPMFESPIPMGAYQFTSTFANRWGSFHGGIDLAAPLGTPIHAVTDGVVVEAGPASGYGNWVQVRASDGTITMYGHMSSSGVLVQKGQHVTAGDVIALVGNEGFSTGPHCHFEVWKGGTMKIDPAPWLAEHGVRLTGYSG